MGTIRTTTNYYGDDYKLLKSKTTEIIDDDAQEAEQDDPFATGAHRIADFEKVSLTQFEGDTRELLYKLYGDVDIPTYMKDIHSHIELPTRATSGSAGYDFRSPFGFTLRPGETIKIPTGIRVRIDDGWFLSCYPRSSLGFKYRLQLDNTIGVVDARGRWC